MRRLYPEPGSQDLDGLYDGLTLPAGTGDRPWWVAMCMVASLDGSAVADGLSGGLGGAADLLALSRLRDACDAVLVGAANVRQEGYGPLAGSPERRRSRQERGLGPLPRLAIVTASADLDPASAPFTHPDQRPLLLVPERSESTARRRLGAVADVEVAGEQRVDPATAVRRLADLGLPRVLCEGGPRLNAQMLAADLIDEVFVTVASTTLGGEGPRIAQGPQPEQPRTRRLESAFLHEGDLLLRYRDPRHPPAGADHRAGTDLQG